MTPNSMGRHCDSCSKTVVDFTRKTDVQIAEYFKSNGDTCGRFLPHQLNRNLNLHPAPAMHYGFLKLAACAVISFGAFDAYSNRDSLGVDLPQKDSIADAQVNQNLNHIRFKIDAISNSAIETHTLTFVLGDFSIVFDQLFSDTLIDFHVPNAVEWEQIEILVWQNDERIDTLTLSKAIWGQLLAENQNHIQLVYADGWRIDLPLAKIDTIPYICDLVMISQSYPIFLLGISQPIYGNAITSEYPKPDLDDSYLPGKTDLHPTTALKGINEGKEEAREDFAMYVKHSSFPQPEKSPLKALYYLCLAALTFVATLWTFRKSKSIPKKENLNMDENQEGINA